VVAGPGDEKAGGAVGRSRMRASYADREQVIDALKTAFAHGRLDKDELEARVGQAVASRTYAELAAVTADIPAGPAGCGPVAVMPAATSPTGTPARTMAKAAARTGICLLAAVALAESAVLVGNPLLLVAAAFAIIAASGFFGYGIIDAWQERRSSRQPPPRPGRDGRGLEGGWPGRTGQDPALPGVGPDQTRTDMRTQRSRRGQPHSSRPSAWVSRGGRPAPGAV